MKCLMVLLALGLVSCDKLDRTYLPPPGSKFAGGSDGAIQIPLEFPKDTYSTTLRPLLPGQKDDRKLFSSDNQPTIGIDRTGYQVPQNIVPIGQQGPQNTVPNTPVHQPSNILQPKFPTTTTTYAYTTLPTPQGFETTLSPISSTGYSDLPQDIQTGLVNYELSQNQGYAHNLPGNIQTNNQIAQRLGTNPTPGAPGPNFVGYPGYNKQSSQFFPGQVQNSTISPFYGNFSQKTQSCDLGYTPHLGEQPLRTFGQQVPSSTPSSQRISQIYQTPPIQPYGKNVQGQFIPETSSYDHSRKQYPQTGQPFPSPATTQPGIQYGTDRQENIVPVYKSQDLEGQRPLFGGQPGPLPPGILNQSITNFQGIPRSDFPQQLGQRPEFHFQPNPLPTTSSILQPGSFLQYGNLPGSNIPQQGAQPTPAQEKYPPSITQITLPTNVPQNQGANNQGNIVYGPNTLPHNEQQLQHFNLQNYPPSPVVSPGVSISTAYPYSSGTIPQIGPLQSQPERIVPGQPRPGTNFGTNIQPSQGQLQPNDGRFPMQLPKISNSQNILNSPVPTPTPTRQPSYPSTTPGFFPSTTLSPLGITSTTPFPASPNVFPGNVRLPERPQAEFDRNEEILNYKNILTPDGHFEYSFDTSNGIHADENGTSIYGVKAEGSYSYIGDDGKRYSVVYSADENGFRPYGDHLPTPPPIPEAIQKVIEQAARDKEAGITHDGFYDEDKYGHKQYEKMKTRPNASNKIITNGVDISEDNAPVYLKKDQYRPDQGLKQRKPSKAKVGLNQVRPSQLNLGNIRPQSTRKPINQEEGESEGNFSAIPYTYDRKSFLRVPSRRPSNQKYENSQYGDDDNYFQSKKSQRPGVRGENIHVKTGVTRQPITPRRGPVRQSSTAKYDEYEIEADQDLDRYYDESVNKENDKNLPSTLPDTNYEDQYEQQNSVTGKPMTSKNLRVTTTSSDTDEDDYTSTQSGVYHPQLEKESENNYKKDNIVTNRPSSIRSGFQSIESNQDQLDKFGVTKEEDSYDSDNDTEFQRQGERNLGFTRNKYPIRNDENGYMYLPPQKQFQETLRFPPRVSSQITSRKPTVEEDYAKRTPLRPFITPNVYQVEDDLQDDIQENLDHQIQTEDNIANKKPTKKLGKLKSSKESLDYEEEDDNPQISGKSIKVRPGKAGVSSATSRYPLQQMPARPHYADKYLPEDGVEQELSEIGDYGAHSGNSDGQNPNEVYYVDKAHGTRKPVNAVSSISMSRNRTHGFTTSHPQYEQTYGISSDDFHNRQSFPGSTNEPKIIPGGSILEYTDTTDDATPGYQFSEGNISEQRPDVSTVAIQEAEQGIEDYERTAGKYTPTSTKQPGYEYLNDTQPGSRASETFGTTRKSLFYPGTLSPGSVTLRPPGRQRIQDLPSTTYRPNYTIIDQTTGRPISVNVPGQPVGTTNRFGQSRDQFFMRNQTRFGQKIPQGFGVQTPVVTSSTERVIGEDFSGPKQAQRFDPETGYHY